jgi:hypothetical protein
LWALVFRSLDAIAGGDEALARAWLASLSFGEESLVDGGQCKSIGLSHIGLEKLREVVAAARINEDQHAWSHSSGQLS